MQVSVTFRHINATEALKDFANDRLGRVAKYIPSALSDAHVVLSVEKHHHKADIAMVVNGVRICAQDQSEDMYAAIENAVGKVERQVKRYQNKLSNHKPRDGKQHRFTVNLVEAPEAVEAAEAVETALNAPEIPAQVTETKELDAKPMSLDEAIMQIDLLGEDILVFTSIKTNNLSILYRRKDGKFSLMEVPSH